MTGVGAGKFHALAIHAFVNVQRVAGLESGAGDGGVDRLERFVGRAGILVVVGKVLLSDVLFACDRGACRTPKDRQRQEQDLLHDGFPLMTWPHHVHLTPCSFAVKELRDGNTRVVITVFYPPIDFPAKPSAMPQPAVAIPAVPRSVVPWSCPGLAWHTCSVTSVLHTQNRGSGHAACSCFGIGPIMRCRTNITNPIAMVNGPSPAIHNHGSPARRSIHSMTAPKAMRASAT